MFIKGILIQVIFAIVMFKTSVGFSLMTLINSSVSVVVSMSQEGAKFVFGEGYTEHFVAFSVTSSIVFFSALMAIFFRYGIMQFIVRVMGKVIAKMLPVSGRSIVSVR